MYACRSSLFDVVVVCLDDADVLLCGVSTHHYHSVRRPAPVRLVPRQRVSVGIRPRDLCQAVL